MTNLSYQQNYYDLKKWADQTEIGKQILVWNYFMAGREIPSWTLIKKIPEQTRNDKRIVTYLWQLVGEKEEKLIRIDFVEAGSWRLAQESLLDLLLEHQAMQLPDARSRDIELGDVAYIGFEQFIQFAVFVRANMLIRIQSVGRFDVSILETAKQIDDTFITKPQLSEEGVIPEIELFSADKETIKVNEQVKLNIKARDPLDRPLSYKLMLNLGELYLKGETVYFSSEEAGKAEISFFATNENGFVAGETIAIKIE